MTNYPTLCKNCGAPIVPSSGKWTKGLPPGWTHDLGNLLYRPNCFMEQPDGPNAELAS